VTYEVRVCRPEEQLEALRPIYHYFGISPTPEGVERIARIQPADRVHAVFEGARAVGGAAVFPLRMTVPGGQVPTAGVTMVAVLPPHRRRGILTALMRSQLDDVHERGEPIAVLWASSGSLYGRFGYGMASLTGEIDLAREYAGLAAPVEPVGQAQLVSLEEALAVFPQVWDRVAPETPGMLTRSRDWWEVRRLLDLPERREGGGEHVRAVLEIDGRPEGYALYRIHQLFERGDSAGFVNVLEAIGATPAATREIWRFLLGIDWVASVKARLLPVDHPLFFLLAHPRRMHFRVGDGLWVRLVDVGAALSARSYAAGGAVVFDVADAFCPWNEERWKLEGGEAGRTDDEPDLRLDVTALGSVYLGGFTFAQLERAGRVEELRDGAVARADDVFRTDRAPWCPEIF
jgi:predicted acetyltransferase